MITRITLHIVAEENKEHAFALLEKNTELARKAKGCISRNVYFSTSDPLKGYSITSWETEEDMNRFSADPERPPLEFKGPERQIYERTPSGSRLIFTHTQSDLFKVVDTP